MPANSLNKTFATFGKAVKKDRYLESIQAHLLGLPSYRKFPSDEEFRRDFRTRDLYTNSTRRGYWLRRLENHSRKERVSVDEYTIEHIMPQNENLSSAWQKALGDDWRSVQQTWLHTLGNLTLTGYNSEYSDRSFPEKRDMAGGLKESPLKVNAGLSELADWNEEAIKARADRLAAIGVEIWAAPELPAHILASYRPKSNAVGYSIDDHPQLAVGPMRMLFEAFRKEVTALDPCVTEEFFKTCAAYKAETNFVDVVPQAKRLQLTLNLALADVNDPKGFCEDVSDIGHLGSGDVRLSLTSANDLPYVMSLVRQSFERQMSNAGEI
jgi:predicted transport protein